jgi:hypothetical protein
MAVHLPGFVSGYLLFPVGSANFFRTPQSTLDFFFRWYTAIVKSSQGGTKPWQNEQDGSL